MTSAGRAVLGSKAGVAASGWTAAQTEASAPAAPSLDLGLTRFLDGEGGIPAPGVVEPGWLVEFIGHGPVAPAVPGTWGATGVLHLVQLSSIEAFGANGRQSLASRVLEPF